MSSVPNPGTVYIVDDDASVRDSLSLLLSLHGYVTAMFACGEDFLRAQQPHWRGVVLADIRMPGMSGLDMQAQLAGERARLPVIIITGHGDVAAARQAFKANAVDFLEKPFDEGALLRAVEKALGETAAAPAVGTRPQASTLSQREREVMALVVDGLDNRTVGERLGISPRTVEVHKSRLMAKLGARNLAELMRMAHGGGA
jgi:FixJ family two-component response regulator